MYFSKSYHNIQLPIFYCFQPVKKFYMVQYKTHGLILPKTIYMTYLIKTLFHTK